MATSEDGKERPSRVERVRERALQIYEERLASGTPGDEMQDWVRAEAEIRDEAAEERSAGRVASKHQ